MSQEDKLITLLQSQFIVRIDDAYHDGAVDDFLIFIRQIRKLFQNIHLLQYQTVTAFAGNIPEVIGKGKLMSIENIHAENTNNLVVNFVKEDIMAVINDDGIDFDGISANTFVYRWSATEENADQFIINGEKIPFSSEVTPDEGSFFCKKTYNDLDEAFIDYRDNFAPMCRGRALAESMTKERLFFNPAPEGLLQEALSEYLRCRLRQCDVKREHNVDTSHPVDIRIRWRDTNHQALVEVKWLGTSLKDGKISTTYTDARAREGARQLVSYIDNNQDSFPKDVTVGYLVVYDLRRQHNNDVARTTISRVDANHYKDKEISYDPQYWLDRKDFKKPYRFFVKVSNDTYED